ncbi:MAG TPA: chromosome partition protein MukB [Polyangiaceae bacterium]|nr:chromosome partition protein MukB [Polyangiaceae bacterium]
MTERARATSLILVNWKGVFYERYALDRHVTALEGANGAGKTTVMIAAYVVLLPDLTRLKFTNVGESSAAHGDRGVYGRLGEGARPAYAAMEFVLPNSQRVIAGVLLERKAEPSLSLSPFLISGQDLGARVRQLFLLERDDHEFIPELKELRESVKALGGTLESFASTRDYFARLFELGVTPLRLTTDEDKNKLNEMLRTSMTGGISRALTSELRNFLFKEESGLSDTLSRMRENLEACHRTRIEVAEARRLEHEINGIFETGQAMFAASVWASRKHAEEARAALLEAEAARQQAAAALVALNDSVLEVNTRRQSILERCEVARKALEQADRQCERAARAQALRGQQQQLQADLARARAELAAREQEHAQRLELRKGLRAERDGAREAYDRAAHGLAHVQAGLAELHKNAHARRHALEQLMEARAMLARPEFEVDEIDGELERLRTRLNELDAEGARSSRELDSFAARERDYERALSALNEIAEVPSETDAFEHARAALARAATQEHELARAPELARELERLRELARRQQRARERAEKLGLSLPAQALEVEKQLVETEERMRALEREVHSEATEADGAQRQIAALEHKLERLALESSRFSELRLLCNRVGLEPPWSRERLLALRKELTREREACELERINQAIERERLQAELGGLTGGSGANRELSLLCDELDAELYANRFEDLEPAEARVMEARLGPLSEALVVEDPAAAAQRVAGQPRERDTVWLLPPHVEPRLPASRGEQERDLIIEEAEGFRVTRLPTEPRLGRRARERRASDLRERIQALTSAAEQTLARAQRAESTLRDSDAILEHGDLLGAVDPEQTRALTERELQLAQQRERQHRERGEAARLAREALHPRLESLRALLAESFLLEDEAYAERAAECEAQLRAAHAAESNLRRSANARRVLGELLDVLRGPRPTEQARAELRSEFERKNLERDRAFRAQRALQELKRCRPALAFEDAESALAEQRAVVPALEAQLETAKTAAARAEAELSRAEATWEESVTSRQSAEADVQALLAHISRVEVELSSEAEAGALYVDEERARAEAIERSREYTALDREERTLSTELALREERKSRVQRMAEQAEADCNARQSEAEPRSRYAEELARSAEAAGILTRALSQRFESELAPQGSERLRVLCQGKASQLLDRLRSARGGQELANLVENALRDKALHESLLPLKLWLEVRNWLQSRLPVPIGGSVEPLESLAELRDGLTLLEQRLTLQERDLTGTSEDVARSIDVQLRRAKAQVRRLNQNLEGIRFGSIAGIRVQMRRIERMDQVLTALREGSAQSLLFQSALPIEEALDELFRRYAGGRSGGQRLLDYREYAELIVEIRRQSRDDWEAASPARLSTGEAIGVGAALMMVILTEWERDARLLRGKRDGGSLRFLFLDEANRLSQDNLGVLFDLCQSLDLQLLIAAPEVAKAHGNTTYRLVRRINEDGQEEVLVSGRRTIEERGPEPDEPSAEETAQRTLALIPELPFMSEPELPFMSEPAQPRAAIEFTPEVAATAHETSEADGTEPVRSEPEALESTPHEPETLQAAPPEAAAPDRVQLGLLGPVAEPSFSGTDSENS